MWIATPHFPIFDDNSLSHLTTGGEGVGGAIPYRSTQSGRVEIYVDNLAHLTSGIVQTRLSEILAFVSCK